MLAPTIHPSIKCLAKDFPGKGRALLHLEIRRVFVLSSPCRRIDELQSTAVNGFGIITVSVLTRSSREKMTQKNVARNTKALVPTLEYLEANIIGKREKKTFLQFLTRYRRNDPGVGKASNAFINHLLLLECK